MTEENSKFDIKVSPKKGKSTKKKNPDNVDAEKLLNIDKLVKADEPVFVKMKEDWVDRIGKYAALSAVLLAIFMACFDYRQSKNQDAVFKLFQQKLDSTFNNQRINAEKQQQLMKNQSDSTILLLKIQADRLKAQNEIWKINQKNEIHTERVKISPTVSEYYLRNDSLKIRFNYSNNGQRVAMNIECKIAIIQIKNNSVLAFIDEKASFTMNKIIPGNTVFWKINKDFPSIKEDSDVYLYSSLTYEDEMYQHKFVTTEFIRIFNKNKKTEYSFCQQNQIDFIEKNSKYKDLEIEDFAIKEDKLFK
ncbi:MAG: hypothetical protein Q8N05_13260 [Bacteroidota bacterium]|nr:hypothetical protein [Bacteroidota bacterium]